MILPLINKEEKPQNTFCCHCTLYSVVICLSLYDVISTMLLPLTVRGRIGGQYGVLRTGPPSDPGISLTDMPFENEVIVIIPFILLHLMGCISVIKKHAYAIGFYLFLRTMELPVYFYWLPSVFAGCIKSYTMSQSLLGWYCSFSFVIHVISGILVASFLCEQLQGKEE